MNILTFTLQTLFFGIVQTVGIVLGLFIVPIMLIFGKMDSSTAIAFTANNTSRKWVKEVFPKVFWPWDNVEDSSVGDKRGWWDANCFGADAYKWINRFWWLAVRNPFNNFKRYVIGIDVRDYVIVNLAGQHYVRDDVHSTGWQWLKAESMTNKMPRYMLYIVKQYPAFKLLYVSFKRVDKWYRVSVSFGLTEIKNRALVVQIGNKIKMEHNYQKEEKEIDYWKGFTIECNPFKDIS